MQSYDPEKRAKEVEIQLSNLFKSIQENKPHMHNVTDSNPDIFTMRLESIQKEVEALTRQVGEFDGPHFNKIYRTLQGEFEKLQKDLDHLKITGREDIQGTRRNLLVDIEKLAAKLSLKTHADGQSCRDCEVCD